MSPARGSSRYAPHPCPTCGKLFHNVDRPKQIYCSWDCRWPKGNVGERLYRGVVKDDGCWEKPSPYHSISIDGHNVGAHRLAYRLAYGPIPDGLYVCHRCDNKRCIRPDHLFLGTNRDNQLDALSKGLLPIGSHGPSAKLTETAVVEIKRELARGANKTHLARRYGVSRCTVQAIGSGRHWRSVA